MFALLKKGVFALARSNLRETVCPHCKHRFDPFADKPPETFADLKNFVCPKCGKQFSWTAAATAKQLDAANPDGPFEQPPDSRIERRDVSESELLFYFPASGRWGGMLVFAILWNAISWTVFSAFIFAKSSMHGSGPPLLFVSLFPLVGLGLAYAAIRTRFATHLLFLGPEFVRLQRSLFRRKNFDVPTAEIVHVKKVEFYQQNYQPIYGIEIGAGKRRIRFGSVLTDPEKNWLCWEIREFLRAHGASV